MEHSGGPSKTDIEAVFNRLRAQGANKTCFDCNAKNPTWSSVTYGVFICIDCSAVHRNLGVHLTFVRSTNLDTNWTWVQLRQMQLGGNANAAQFFRQHNCITTDAQQKYNSRAAQLYRDKISSAAQQAIKKYGTALFLDSNIDAIESTKKNEDDDFFAECNEESIGITQNNNFVSTSAVTAQEPCKRETHKVDNLEQIGVPKVDFLNSTVLSDAPKSTIGVRKIQPKRGLGGAKKGVLGATKVKTNFADLEHQANLADQQKDKVPEKKLTEKEEAETIASVRLAYQDLSLKAQKQEEKLKHSDPTKAKQMERLGMGFNVRGHVSHSALSDMQTIAQEPTPTPKFNAKCYEREPKDDFLDDYATSMYATSKQLDPDLAIMGFETIEPIDSRHSNISSMFTSTKNSPNNVSSFHKPNQSSTSVRNDIKSTFNTPYETYENEDAQKKFGGAKAISSDQFFCSEASSFERSANLAKFQGSNSISSAEYFGDNKNSASSSRGMNEIHYSGPDLEDVRESVRQGVTKVAGRLSSLANGVMTSLQDKYGG